MNHLAHFHLAHTHPQSSDGLIIGALLGDFVKGPLERSTLSDAWVDGIRLHRRIDALTDNHPVARSLAGDFPEPFRRYAGIMLDICFDRCLNNTWEHFHPDASSAEFADAVLDILERESAALPPGALRLAGRMRRYQLLTDTTNWDTVNAILSGIGARLRRDNPLDQAAEVLISHYPRIEAGFLELYPQIIDATAEFPLARLV